MNENGAKRAWLAAILAFVYPGLGHAYLGLWGRALVWAATSAVTAVLFLPDDGVAVDGVEGVAALAPSLSATALFMLATVTAMAAVDAYWHATGGAASDREGDAPSCPECGKPVDEDLAFCQWCTVEFE